MSYPFFTDHKEGQLVARTLELAIVKRGYSWPRDFEVKLVRRVFSTQPEWEIALLLHYSWFPHHIKHMKYIDDKRVFVREPAMQLAEAELW